MSGLAFFRVPGVKYRPVPPVGARVRLDWGPTNPNTWKTAGVVRAIVDDHLVVRRWFSHRRAHYLELIPPERWTTEWPWIVRGR